MMIGGLTLALFLAAAPGDFDPLQAKPAGVATADPEAGQAWTTTDFGAADPKLPTLFIAGDSTAAPGDPRHRGWGAVLARYFDPAKLKVINRARGGRSFRTYFHEGLWRQITDHLKPGDFVLIEFGHNDGGRVDGEKYRGDVPGLGEDSQEVLLPDGALETVHSFGWYARRFVDDVRAKGAVPILCSTTVRNIWNNGKVERGLGPMLGWIKQVAGERKVLFVDHSNLIADRYEALGPERVAKYFPADHTHTSTAGAVLNAEALIAGLRSLPAPGLTGALKTSE